MHHPTDDSDEEQMDEFAEQYKILMSDTNSKRIDVVLGKTSCELKTFDPEIHTQNILGGGMLVKQIAIARD